MQLMEMARLIGLTIKNSPEGKDFDEAKAAYEADPDIGRALTEYRVQKALIDNRTDGDGAPMDAGTLTRINDRINELYDFIVGHEKYKTYEAARKALSGLIGKVNSTILAQVTGETPRECGHNCSECGGCR